MILQTHEMAKSRPLLEACTPGSVSWPPVGVHAKIWLASAGKLAEKAVGEPYVAGALVFEEPEMQAAVQPA
jgi:hypothetical protein